MRHRYFPAAGWMTRRIPATTQMTVAMSMLNRSYGAFPTDVDHRPTFADDTRPMPQTNRVSHNLRDRDDNNELGVLALRMTGNRTIGDLHAQREFKRAQAGGPRFQTHMQSLTNPDMTIPHWCSCETHHGTNPGYGLGNRRPGDSYVYQPRPVRHKTILFIKRRAVAVLRPCDSESFSSKFLHK